MLKKNMGTVDRVLRFILGAGLLVAYFMVDKEAGYRPFLLIGIIPLATSLLSSCPIYSILGVSTCPMKSSDSK